MQSSTRLTFVFALVSLISTLLLLTSCNSFVKGCQLDSECNYPFYDNVLNQTMNGVNLVCLNGTCACDGSQSYYYNATFCAPLCSNSSQCGHGACNTTTGMCECHQDFDGVHCEEYFGASDNNNNGSNPNPNPQPQNNNGTNNNGSNPNPNPPVDPCKDVKCKNGVCKNGTCECNPDFTGPQCDQPVNPNNNGSNPNPQPQNNNGTNNNGSNPNPNPPVDPCKDVQCKNGVCKNGTCECNPDFTGPHCDQPVNPPNNNGSNPNPQPQNNNGTNNNGSNPNPNPPVDPCKDVQCKNGVCVNGTCKCNPDFTGPHCDQPINPPNNNGTNNNGSNPNPNPPVDPCKDVQCKNGVCVNGTCKCNPDFTGPHCDQPINPPNNNGTNNNGSNPNPNPNPPVDPCKDVQCKNGVCVNGTCKCNPDFTGPRCDQPINPPNNNGSNPNPPIDPCKDVQCKNGVCVNGTCKCNPDFTGPRCDQPINPPNNNGSNPNPPVDTCKDVPCKNGACVNGTCKCNPGYGGVQCEKLLPPPPPQTCGNVNCTGYSACEAGVCVCFPGFNPPSCLGPDPCSGVTCGNNQHCFDGGCICNNGYTGPKCDQPTNNATKTCLDITCPENQQCKEGVCVCNGGYFGVNCTERVPNKCENVMSPSVTPFCSSILAYPVFSDVLVSGLPSMDQYTKYIIRQATDLDVVASQRFNNMLPVNPLCQSAECLNGLKTYACVSTLMPCANNFPQTICQPLCYSIMGNPQLAPIFSSLIDCKTLPTTNCFGGPNSNNTNVDKCANVKCGNNQRCMEGVCICNDGYTGLNCDQPIGPNNNSTGGCNCRPNQHCENNVCVCNQGYIGNSCTDFIEPRCENIISPTTTPFCSNSGYSYQVVNYALIGGLQSKDQYSKYILERAKYLDDLAVARVGEGLIANPACTTQSCKNTLMKIACFMYFTPCANNAYQLPCQSFCKSIVSDPSLSPEFVAKMDCSGLPSVNCYNGQASPSQTIKCYGFASTDKSVCSGHGSCVDADKCQCVGGYKGNNCETADCSSAPCKNGGKCEAPNVCKCPAGFSGSDCSIFIPTPGCFSVMNPKDTPFCSSVGVSHPLYNINYLPENANATNKDDFDAKMKAYVSQLDNSVRNDAAQMLKNYPACTSKSCINQINRLSCYNKFKVCLNAAQNSASLCKGACETLVDLADVESLNTTKAAFCEKFPTSECAAGVFVADTTTCFGKNLKAPGVCNGNGRCIGQDQCSCYYGFSGAQCNAPTCFGKAQDDSQVCGGKGKCVSPNTCNCKAGYSGLECDVKTCNGKTEQAGGCSFNGRCTDVDVCECRGNFDPSTFCLKCKTGYTGPNCQIPICFNTPATDRSVCNGKGSCQGPNSCQCLAGFSGSSCQSYSCDGIERTSPNVCSGHGKCVGPNTCQCDLAWTGSRNCSSCSPAFKGDNCKEAMCTDEGTCGGKGVCQGLRCVCNGNYAGQFCEKCIGGFVGANCSISCNPSTCSGRGTCKDDGSCECKSANADPLAKCAPGKCINSFEGDNCDYKFDTTSIKFNANGDRLTATAYSSLKRPIPCDQIFQDASKLGERSQCVFNSDKSTLEIILGPNAAVTTNDVLKPLKYPGSKDANNALVNAGDFIAAAPTASLVGDKTVVSTCDDLFLNAYGSVSLDRRPLTFSWSVSSGPSSSDETTLTNAIKSETRGGLRIKLNEVGLSAGTYIVSVTVTSNFGISDTKSFSFTVIANAVPALFIKQGAESKFMIGSVSTINPIIKFPSCYNGNGQIQFNYTLDESQSVASVMTVTKNGMLVLGAGFTEIKKEGDYYFTVTATANGAEPTSTNFKVSAIAQPLILAYSIDNIIQSVQDPISFSIRVIDPSNTNDAQNVSMTCYDLLNGQDCTIQPGFVSSFTSDKFTAGSYQFTTTVTKGSRVATRYLYVTLLDQAKDSILKVSITSNIDLSVVDPSKDLYLTYSTWGAVPANPSFVWTAENFDLGSNATTTSSYLKIPSSLLSPGDSYTVSLVVTDGEKEGSAKTTFTVNSPPTQGQFDVYPTTGKALSDVFDIKCGNGWSDPQTPLTYQFMFLDKAGNKWNPLTDRTEVPSASISLPQPTSGNILTIKAVVYDSLGASSYATFDVTITKPSADESVSALSTMASSKGTVTLSGASSAMSVIGSFNSSTLNSTQIDSIKQAASVIADAFLEQQSKTESISVSKTSTENGLSFASSFSSSVSSGMVSDTTTSKVVDKLSGTTAAVLSNGIEISPEMIDNVKKSADNFLGVIQKGQQSKRSFSKVDLANINAVYTNLATLTVKDAVADLPSTVVTASGVTTLTRKVNIATLNSLSEKISGNHKINLSAKFSQLSQLASFKTLNLMAKVIDVTDVANYATKAIDFKLVDSTSVTISNTSSIADLVFEVIKKRELMGTENTCKVLNTNTNTYETATGCTLTTNNDGTITASVSSTGTYIITSQTTVDPGTSTTPKPIPTPLKSTKINASSNLNINVLMLLFATLFAVLMM